MATTPLCCIYRLQRKRKEKSSHQITTLLSSKPDIKGEPRGRSIKDPINKNGVKNTHSSFSLDLWSCTLKACLQLSSYTVMHPLIFRQWYFMFMGYGGESGYNCLINRSSTFKAPTVLHNFLLIQLKHSIPDLHPNGGAGIAQWLEHRTCDWKVAGSNPCWNSGRILFSRVDFLCWLLFRYPFHPRVTTVARKKSRSFCQKCRWQVTAKHAYTLRMWILLNRASALVTTCP